MAGTRIDYSVHLGDVHSSSLIRCPGGYWLYRTKPDYGLWHVLCLLKAYEEAKQRHPNMLLLFRCGAYFELLHKDAETAAKLLYPHHEDRCGPEDTDGGLPSPRT